MAIDFRIKKSLQLPLYIQRPTARNLKKPILLLIVFSLCLTILLYTPKFIFFRDIIHSRHVLYGLDTFKQSEGDHHIKQIHHFKRCGSLNYSWFNTETVSEHKIAKIIDQKSLELENELRRKYPSIENQTDSLLRYTCYQVVMAADNENKGKLLEKMNISAYFPSIPFLPQPEQLVFHNQLAQSSVKTMHVVPEEEGTKLKPAPKQESVVKTLYPSRSQWRSQTSTHVIAETQKRQQVKMAYLLFVGDYSEDDNHVSKALKVIEAISSEDSVILVYVDHSLEKVQQDLKEQTKKMNNVFVSPRRFNLDHKLSSMVFAQLAGYFDLLDIADWNFVVNLDIYDYPIRSNKYIHRALRQNTIYIESWEDHDIEFSKTRQVSFYTKDFKNIQQIPSRTDFPFEKMYPAKQSQWMILPRSYVDYLRKGDEEAHQLLMYVEHAKSPIDWFYTTSLSREDHPFYDAVMNDHKRYIAPYHGMQYNRLTYYSLHEMVSRLAIRDFFFAREIDNTREMSLTVWMDNLRVESEKYVPPLIKNHIEEM